MGKNIIKTKRAGRLVYKVCFPLATSADPPAERAAKKRASTEARQKLNFKAAWQRLELLLAANFTESDCWATLTYDDEHLPPDRAAAKKEINRFLRRLRDQYRRRGWTLKYIYNTEAVPDAPGEPHRLHHHIILSPFDPELIRSQWRGGHVHTERLLDGEFDSYEPRARYMVKERHPETQQLKKGERAWTPSRNLAKPIDERPLYVDETQTIQPPPRAYVLNHYTSDGYIGKYTYLKYLEPKPRPPAGRRRS